MQGSIKRSRNFSFFYFFIFYFFIFVSPSFIHKAIPFGGMEEVFFHFFILSFYKHSVQVSKEISVFHCSETICNMLDFLVNMNTEQILCNNIEQKGLHLVIERYIWFGLLLNCSIRKLLYKYYICNEAYSIGLSYQ